MAGDWIKMRSNLWDDPRVSRLCDLTDQSEAAVIGALYWLWATADQHSEDGCMPGLTLRQIDRKTGIAGFGAALCEIDWIRDDPQGIVITRFEEHNGSTAKRRCSEAQRKANTRNLSASDADTDRTETGRDAELEKDIEKEKEKEKEKKEPKSKAVGATASRLPADWAPNELEISFCQSERPDLDVNVVASRFRDYWVAQPGAKGRKVDWTATWRNWVRNERTVPQARGSPAKPEKFDPTAYVNRNRNQVQDHERTIDINPTGEPV